MDQLTTSIMERVAAEPDPTPVRAFAAATRAGSARDALASAAGGWRVATMRDRRITAGSRMRGLALAIGVTGALVASSSVVLGAAAVGAVTVVQQIAQAGGMDVLPDRGGSPAASPAPSVDPAEDAQAGNPAAQTPDPVLVVLPPDDDYDLDPSVPRDTAGATDTAGDDGGDATEAGAGDGEDADAAAGDDGSGESANGSDDTAPDDASTGDDDTSDSEATPAPAPTADPGGDSEPDSQVTPGQDAGDVAPAPGTDPEGDSGD